MATNDLMVSDSLKGLFDEEVRQPRSLISLMSPIRGTITKIKNIDTDGLFIKKHIKELQDLDKNEIHDPSEKHRNHLNYPNQILNLKESRLRAIDAFNDAKN